MDAEEFRRYGREMVDFVADYLENIRDRRPFPEVEPGFMRDLLPKEAPEQPEGWDKVFPDIEKVIMPGVTHWHSPQFHAYFPTANSYPAICADILSAAIGCIGFSWASCPSCTELEVIVLDWLGKMLKLPEQFLSCSGKTGGGVIQGTASEATLVALLSARSQVVSKMKMENPHLKECDILSKLVAYSSDQAHSSVERAALIGFVKMRKLKADAKSSLQGLTLEKAIEEDRTKGLVPFFVCATLGSTASCGFDNLLELGPICEKENIWLHIDAAYAGSSFICPEYRPLLNGVEYAMSFNFNPHKWMQVNFDCSAMWVKDSSLVSDAFNVDPLYLKYENQGKMPDYRHWHIPLGRRFRSLKLWFVLRMNGVANLQEYIRKDIRLAHRFEDYIKNDERFEIFGEVTMALVCFRVKGTNELNKKLLKVINTDGRIHLVPSEVQGTYFLRLAVCAKATNSDDIDLSWRVINELTSRLLQEADKST